MAACARRHVSRRFRPLLGLQPRRARSRRRGGAVSIHPAVDHPLLLSVPEGEAKRRAGRRGDAGTLALTGAMDAHRAAHICAASHRRGGSGRQSAASEVNEGQKLLVIAVVLSSPRLLLAAASSASPCSADTVSRPVPSSTSRWDSAPASRSPSQRPSARSTFRQRRG